MRSEHLPTEPIDMAALLRAQTSSAPGSEPLVPAVDLAS